MLILFDRDKSKFIMYMICAENIVENSLLIDVLIEKSDVTRSAVAIWPIFKNGHASIMSL